MNTETTQESMGYRPNYTEILTHVNFYETYKKFLGLFMPVALYPCILALCFFEFTKAREDKALDQGHCKKVFVHYNFVSPLKCSTLALHFSHHFSHEKDWSPLSKKKKSLMLDNAHHRFY